MRRLLVEAAKPPSLWRTRWIVMGLHGTFHLREKTTSTWLSDGAHFSIGGKHEVIWRQAIGNRLRDSVLSVIAR